MSAGPIVLSHPLAKTGAPVLDDVRSASMEFASRARRGGLSPHAIGWARYMGHPCDYFATLKRITTRFHAVGPGPHPKRTIMCADSVCTRGTADPFGQFVV